MIRKAAYRRAFGAGRVAPEDRTWLRNLAGGTPNARLKARLNAGSDSYPTSAAIRATLPLVVRSIRAPS